MPAAADVLDVATGTGVVLLDAARRMEGHSRLVGIDLSSEMLRRAAAEAQRQQLANVQLLVMDAQHLRFEENTFDVVFCAFAFASIPDKRRAIAEFNRVLRPGGRVCISNAFGWYFDQDRNWAWQRDLLARFGVVLDPEQSFAPEELVRLLAAARMRGIETTQETHELRFRDEEEWWRWSWSHGTRMLFEAVPEPLKDDLRQDAVA